MSIRSVEDFEKRAKAIRYLVPGCSYSEVNGEPHWEMDTPLPTEEDIAVAILAVETEESESVKRLERNSLLGSSDWTVLPHSPLSEAEQAAWISYRQELRDFTAQANWVDLPFPNKP